MFTRLPIVLLSGFVLIAVSACGGGGGSLTSMEEQALQEQVEEAEAAKEEAERQAEEAERQRQAAEEERLRAEEEARQAELEAEEAEEAEQERLRAAEEAAEEAERLRQEAEQESEQLQQQLTEAQQAELRARASAFGTAIGDGDDLGEATATVTWPRGGSRTFRPSGVTFAAGSAAPSVPGGWSSASFTGQTGTTATALVDETVYLYTNIQAPGTRAFWKLHGLEVTGAQAGTHSPTPTGTARVVRVGNNTLDHASPDTFNIAVSGTYDGVSGTYTCAACTIADGMDEGSDVTAADFDAELYVMLGDNGRTFATGNVWDFKPGSINSGVQQDQDDAYLYFGIWSSIPDNISDSGYDFEYIAGGGADPGADLSNFNALTGSATFRGGAVGKYVTQGQVGGQNAKIGTFTATATLNADFGDAPVDGSADTAPGTISGSITDLREDGSPLAGWSVTLGSDGNVGAASTIGADGTARGDTLANIGGLSVGGSWGATFYGSDNEILEDRDEYPALQYPPVDLAGVTGWFRATSSGANNASLAGAFAATPSN